MKIIILCITGFTIIPAVTRAGTQEDEEQYVDIFGNYGYNFMDWHAAKSWYDEPGEKRLRKFCADAHKVAGYGDAAVDTVILDRHRLKLEYKNHKSREIDVLTYGINGTLWYITDGGREGCVFYLDLSDQHEMIFKLQKQVCGIEHVEFAEENFNKMKISGPLDY